MNKSEKLLNIFDEIYHLNVCSKDTLKVRRDIAQINLNSKVMIIAEAMAPKQVRLSGVNYFYKDGRIGNTGKSLEKFLNLFNHSVYPENPNCIYHTEIVHNFPGYIKRHNKQSIRRPTQGEIKLSMKSGILQKEIDIIKPRTIILMGNIAYQTFYKYFLNIIPKNSLTNEIEQISLSKSCNRYENIPVIPIQHSSGANPRFNKMFKNKNLIKLITELINTKK